MRDVCYKLANWRAKHQKTLADRRKHFSEKTGQFGTFDPDNYVLSNPHVMAGLAVFSVKPDSERGLMGREGKEEIFKHAIRRAKETIVFYRGLKDFARDPASRDTIEQITREETQHIRRLVQSLEQKQLE